VSLALGYFGVSSNVSVPIAALTLVALTTSGSFRSWERFMFVFVFANLLIIPLAIYAHPGANDVAYHFVVPGVRGGFNSTAVLLIIAIVGTTVAPWQLFFQQSNIVDKKITTKWINYERADTVIGSFVAVTLASLILVTVATVFRGTPLAGHFSNAAGVAHGLAHYLGRGAGAMYSIVLLNASIIGAASVTLSTTYAFGDIFGSTHSLNRRFREAKFFYASYAVLVVLAGAIVLIPNAPLGLITTAVQALAGILLPSATVFLLLLCNDKAVLGPWVNRPWLNIVAGLIVSTLFVLSLILMVTTVFPSVDVVQLLVALGSAMVASFLIAVVVYAFSLAGREPEPAMTPERRANWRMPSLALLAPPRPSRTRSMTLGLMWGYLALSVTCLLIKAFQIG